MAAVGGALSAHARAVLDTLLRHGELGSADLAVACGLDAATVGKALGELDAAGLAEQASRDVASARVDGRVALRGLMDQAPTDLTRSLLVARRALDDVLAVPLVASPGLERITDRARVVRRVHDVVAEARREVLNLHAGTVPTPDQLTAARSADVDLLDRGVAVRTVCPHDFAVKPHLREYAELLAEHGAQTRFADRVPHRLLVVDRRTAIVPIDTDDPARGAVVVREPAVVRCLHQLATTILRGSASLEEALTAEQGPTDLERRVLMLMSSGLTDAVSAKRLSVTERQFRRYVARVMERLGAQSRFQAGVRAVERGWL